jgi:predicted PurR-regulated permease PerM
MEAPPTPIEPPVCMAQTLVAHPLPKAQQASAYPMLAPAAMASWVRPLQCLAAIAVLMLMREAQAVLLPIALAVALAFVLTGPVQRLRRLGVPEAYGAGIVVGVLLLVLALLGVSLASPAAEWMERVPTTLRQLLDTLDRVRDMFSVRATPASMRAEADAIHDKLATEGLLLTRVVVGQSVQLALSAAATVILLYFLLASQHWLLSRTIEVVRKRRARALLLSGIRQAQREIGLFLGTMTLINICVGVVTGSALAVIGLPNPVLWGTLVGLLNFIPYLGPAIATGMLLLAGSMTFGTGTAMLAAPALFLVVHAVEANIVSPLVIGHRLQLSPLSVFLSVMLWGWIWGFGGTLVATPILLGLRSLCQRRRTMRHVCFYLEGACRKGPSLQVLLKVRDRRAARVHSRRPPQAARTRPGNASS